MKKKLGTKFNENFSRCDKFAIVKGENAIVLRHRVVKGCAKGTHKELLNCGKEKHRLGRCGYLECSLVLRLAPTVVLRRNCLDRMRAV